MNKLSKSIDNNYISPQCQHFVIRKKRLCRMTVKPGKNYCGEHEPQPQTDDGQNDTRVPCPNDPKHTCYASKLEKHLTICNARQQEQPQYLVHNVNVPPAPDHCPRLPLAKTPLRRILQVIDKVNVLYDTYLKNKIVSVPERPIHSAVLPEFSEAGRAHSSRRHLRQASSLLHLVESEGLVADHTAYVELGAGKGQLSCFAWRAWCRRAGRVLLVDRAALRHKRDNALPAAGVQRLRADLAHLLLERVPAVQASGAVVGYAKHLCGVATDLALRCVSAGAGVRGVVLATCCHHRCERAAYPAAPLHKLGIDGDDFNTILGIVSWATCGDGRSRDRRNQQTNSQDADNLENKQSNETHETDNPDGGNTESQADGGGTLEHNNTIPTQKDINMEELGTRNVPLSQEQREEVGRRAKALLDWGRVLFLKERGFDARLVHFVPTSVSLENVCIVAKKVENS